MSAVTKLKENWEFRRAFTRGKATVTPEFVVYIVKTGGTGVRLGISAGKKLGCAVQRNRAKRVLTAAFVQCLPHISGNFDFVLVARHRILSKKSTQVFEALQKILKQNGIYE